MEKLVPRTPPSASVYWKEAWHLHHMGIELVMVQNACWHVWPPKLQRAISTPRLVRNSADATDRSGLPDSGKCQQAPMSFR